ncbi:unnamed protein product [Choristocarpus tenellus]
MSESEVEDPQKPIDGGDEDDEDIVGGRSNGAGVNSIQGGPSVAIEEVEEPSKKKQKRNKAPPFSDSNLVSEKGLLKIYQDFPSKCKYKGWGHEAEFLRGLMFNYKEWGYQLNPSLAFEDLTSRIEKLGGKARVRQLMGDLREKERDRYLASNLGPAAVNNVRAFEAAKTASKEVIRTEKKQGKDSVNHRYSTEGAEDYVATQNMLVDEAVQQRNGEGDSAKDLSAAASHTLPYINLQSPEVRDRMEKNRRLALERLKRKKDTTVAAQSNATVSTNRVLPISEAGVGGSAGDGNRDDQGNRSGRDDNVEVTSDVEDFSSNQAGMRSIPSAPASLLAPTVAPANTTSTIDTSPERQVVRDVTETGKSGNTGMIQQMILNTSSKIPTSNVVEALLDSEVRSIRYDEHLYNGEARTAGHKVSEGGAGGESLDIASSCDMGAEPDLEGAEGPGRLGTPCLPG